MEVKGGICSNFSISNEGVNYNHTCFLEIRTWEKIKRSDFSISDGIMIFSTKKSAYYTDTNDEDSDKKEVIHCLFCSFIACFLCHLQGGHLLVVVNMTV